MQPFCETCSIKDLKFFRITVILRGLSATFRDISRFINQSLVFYFQAQPHDTCWKVSPRFSFLFFKYFFFYILIISDFPSKRKLFMLIELTLYKNLYKNVILRGHVFVFLQIILQLSFRFIAPIK